MAMIHSEPLHTYQTSMSPSARHERTSERLAEELELKLHIDSLPIPRSVRLNEYSIPSDGIRWDIFDKNITKLLGEEAYLWNSYSRPEDGWYTMYATSPLTISQINDLKAWTAQANEEDRMAAEAAWKTGGKDDHHRVNERNLIRLERERREARDQERWQREKRRREFEREIAWEERKRVEWRRYFRQKAVADEEARKADKMGERIRRMEIMRMGNDAVMTMEDDNEIPDESEWRKVALKRHLRTGNRWGSGLLRGATSVTKSGDRSMSNGRARYLICNELSNMEWKVVTRITARVHGANQTRMHGALHN